ncbi:MAG: hypothetical protein V4598_19090 [Bdellovibrionota bacterium]
MIYTNLNETEIEKITAILTSCKVQFTVSENENALRALSEGDTFKQTQKNGRRGMPIMQIEIAPEEFKKIPENLKGRLHGLGVFEDIENPFSEEEMQEIIKPKSDAPDVNAKHETPQEMAKQFVIILGVLGLGILWLVMKEMGYL